MTGWTSMAHTAMVVVACCCANATGETARQVKVWAMDSLARIDPLDARPGAASVRISAARNEYEAFQVAVQPAGEAVTVQDVVVGNLVGEGGRKILAKHATRYREHCVYVRRPSHQNTARVG